MSILHRTLHVELALTFDDNMTEVDIIKTFLEKSVQAMMTEHYTRYRCLSADWTYDLEDAEVQGDDAGEHEWTPYDDDPGTLGP